MKSTRGRWALALVALSGLARAAYGADMAPRQPTPAPAMSRGGALFKTYCASCHGRSGKGDGPVAARLRRRPPDLTRLAARNGGVFDADRVIRLIDGRQPVAGHGGADMPVWGDAFRGPGEGEGGRGVRIRIEAIAEHLRSIQIK